jgi:hypothetical protein
LDIRYTSIPGPSAVGRAQEKSLTPQIIQLKTSPRAARELDFIEVIGAQEHNLKNIDVTIPRASLTVVTGLSGSGKSSLAIDTLYSEGQRRYVESLSAYARQFLGVMEKPDVDSIEGLSPAISIEQKTTSHNPRSTVGTVTEIHDYFRLMFARIGKPHCHKCGRPITSQTVQQITDSILQAPEGSRIQGARRLGRYHHPGQCSNQPDQPCDRRRDHPRHIRRIRGQRQQRRQLAVGTLQRRGRLQHDAVVFRDRLHKHLPVQSRRCRLAKLHLQPGKRCVRRVPVRRLACGPDW